MPAQSTPTSSFKVSVVIPVWNEWHHTKNCLDTLRPTLGLRDEVIIVDNGSVDFTATGLKQYPWAKVVTNEENQGFAKGCNQGAAVATGDIIIFLNNDTLLAARWMDALVKPFSDPSVFGTGPRSNYVSGPQLVADVPYTTERMSEYRNFVRAFQQENAGRTEDVTRLVGFCLAIRRDKFEEIGGFDESFGTGGCEDDDICLRLIEAGGRLLICHGSFVHHVGHATFEGNDVDWYAIQQENLKLLKSKHSNAPAVKMSDAAADRNTPFISACLIVKDEAADLPDCLTSLNGLVDEVVIYDTGSTDGTIEIARKAGATVIEGYWDDDFSRARNAALDACSGTWILHIDADERFDGSPSKVRTELRQIQQSAVLVEILNLTDGNKSNLTHRPCRLFKRELWHWSGRLHEQTVLRSGSTERTEVGILAAGKLIHHGYLSEVVKAKDKAERNIRIARLAAEDTDGAGSADALTNLGRSLVLANRNEEALALFIQARAIPGSPDGLRRTIRRAGAQACLALGRPAEALEWVEDFSSESELQDTSRYFRGIAFTDAGEHEKAVKELAGLEKMQDDDGLVFPIWVAQVKLGASYASLGRWKEAAEAVTPAAMTPEMHDESIWALVVESYWRAERNLTKLFAAVPKQHINSILAQMNLVPPAAADTALEALWSFKDKRPSVLALSIRTGPHLSIERALEWSSRLREVGLQDQCPLVAIAWEPLRGTVERVQAIAILHAAFKDDRVLTALRVVAAGAEMVRFEDCLVQLSDLAADLLEPFILNASNSAPRGLALAQALHRLGASEEGVAVLLHALEQGPDQSVAEAAAVWLESLGHTEEAMIARQSAL